MAWSSLAKSVMAGSHFEHEWRTYIIVDGAGGMTVELTDRTHKIGKIKRSTSIIERDWRLNEVGVVFENADNYLTPNRWGILRPAHPLWSPGHYANIWQERTQGEAVATDCHMRIDLSILLPDGTWETKTMFRGRITEVNQIYEDELIGAEITAVWDQIDALDTVFTHDDGDSVEFTAS